MNELLSSPKKTLEKYEKKFSKTTQETTVKSSTMSAASEIELFCKLMTKKAGYHIQNLKQALKFIDDYTPETTTMSESTVSDEENEQIQKLTIEIKNLRQMNLDLSSQRELLEKQLVSSQNENIKIKKELISTNNSTKKEEILLNHIDELADQFNLQTNEISNITKQRNSLIKLLQQQNTLIEKLQDMKAPIIQLTHTEEVKPQIIENVGEDGHFILAKIGNTIVKSIPSLASDVASVMDQTGKSIIDRIVLLVNLLTNNILKEQQHKEENEKLKEEIKKQKSKSTRILTFLEEEIKFLATTSGSENLQKALFFEKPYTGPVMVDNSCRKELLRRSTNVAKFIEENNIKVDENEILTDETQDYTTQIFKLFSQRTLSEQLHNYMVREDEITENTRELFCLFAANVVMSNVLLSFTNEEKERNILLRKEIDELNEQLENAKLEIDRLSTFNKTTIKKLSKLPTFDVTKTMTENMKRIFSIFSDNLSMKESIQSLKEENAKSALTITDMDRQIKSITSSKIESEISLQNQINELHEKLKNYESQIAEANENIEIQKTSIELLEKDKQTQAEIIQKKRDELAEIQANFEDLKNDHESLTKDFEQTKNENEEFSREIGEMRNEISQLNLNLAEAQSNLVKMKKEKENSKNYLQNKCKPFSIATNTENGAIDLIFTRLEQYEKDLHDRMEKIENLESLNSSLNSENQYLKEQENKLIALQGDFDKLKKDALNLAKEAKCALQWRIWASRLLSIFEQIVPNDSEMRLVIEQHALEPSVPRLTKQKIQLLRAQKTILLKNEKIKLLRSDTPLKMRSVEIAAHFCVYLMKNVCNNQ